MVKVRYCSNNSGGAWWLTDEDWLALEAAGWTVVWVKNQPAWGGSDGRFLGALAMGATKNFESIDDAIDEFERTTGACATDDGCHCCGPPHEFSSERI